MQNPPRFPSEDEFDATIETLLTLDSPLSYSLLPSIEAWLWQFNISSRIEAVEILHEAYLRARARENQAEIIRHPSAWLKRFCYNIVREHSRKLDRQRLTEPEMIDHHQQRRADHYPQVSDERLNDRLDVLFDAFQILKRQNPEGAELLKLKYCQDLTWSQVRERLIDRGLVDRGCNVSNAALRQRGNRAIKELRKIFHEIEKASI